MPKSKEFVDSSDSEEAKNLDQNQSTSDDETAKTTKSKKSKANTKDDVSDIYFFVGISEPFLHRLATSETSQTQ